jgi:hypothetical protein
LVIPPLLALLAMASEVPDAPSPPHQVSHKLFFTEVGALTAANALDGYATVRDTNWGYLEESFALGKRPGAGKYVAVEGTIEAATALAVWKLEKSRHKGFRLCGHYLMGIEAIAHVDGAIHDLRNFSRPVQ